MDAFGPSPFPEQINRIIFLISWFGFIAGWSLLLLPYLRKLVARNEIFVGGWDVGSTLNSQINQFIISGAMGLLAAIVVIFWLPKPDDIDRSVVPSAVVEKGLAPTRSDSGVPSQPTPDQKAIVKTPEPTDIEKNIATSPTKAGNPPLPLPDRAGKGHISARPMARKWTPRTSNELMEMVRTKTKRDAMAHQGYWIHVEGSVQDISEVKTGSLSFMPNDSIVLEVAVAPPYSGHSDFVKLHVEADQWKQQVDTIERGDWVVANGVVEYVSKQWMRVINGEIISVSGSGERRRQN